MSVSNLLQPNYAECYTKKLYILDTSNSTDTLTGSLIVSGGAIFKQNLYINGDLDVHRIYADEEFIMDKYHVTSTDNSTSTSTGAVIINGGIGIGKDIFVGGRSVIENTTLSTSISTGAFVVNGGIGVNNISVNNTSSYDTTTFLNHSYATQLFQQYSQFNITTPGFVSLNAQSIVSDTTETTDTSTGALVINGGVAIQKSLNLNGNINIESTTNSLNYTNGSINTNGGVGIEKDLRVHGNLYIDGIFDIPTLNINSTIDSSSVTTGALLTSGGCGISKNLYVGGNINTVASLNVGGIFSVWDTTNSTSTSTGSLKVQGGACIKNNLTVGADLILKDTNVKISANYASPTALKTVFGDGTGWKYYISSKPSGVETDNFLFDDSGNFYANMSVQTEDIVASGKVSITSTTAANSITQGSLIVSGGCGIAKEIRLGGAMYIYDKTDAYNTGSGSLQVSGGMGVAKTIYAGDLYLTSNTSITGTFSNFPSADITLYFKRINNMIFMYTQTAISTTSACTSNTITFSKNIPSGYEANGSVFDVKLIYAQKTSTIANEALLVQFNIDNTISLAAFLVAMNGNQYVIPPFMVQYAH